MTTRVRLSALLLTSSLALAACGGSDSGEDSGSDDVSELSPAKILAAAKKQLAEEDFVTVKGSGSNADEETELEVDLGFANETASGTITVNGTELELLKAGGKAYFKASDEFYRQTAGSSAEQVIKLIDGRWVLADPADDNVGELASFVSKKEFFDELLDPDSTITKEGEKEVNGVDCIGLKATRSTFWFDASDGRPVSLVTAKGGDTLDFTYDEIDEPEAPAADDVVDLAKLGA